MAALMKMFVGNICAQHSKQMLLRSQSAALLNHTPVMYIRKKHRDIKWRQRRREKTLFVKPLDNEELQRYKTMPEDEKRMKAKKEGHTYYERQFQSRDISISNTDQVQDPFIPPEGEGKSSLLGTQVYKDQFDKTKSKISTIMQKRKVKKHEENFNTSEIANDLQLIYIDAHNQLTNVKKNENRLHDLVTDAAYPLMTFGLDMKTFHWEFVESIEPPKVVHIRSGDALIKDNTFAQVTIRMHTKQKLAVYDRFGRLMFGSPHLAKDVIEYVVFEKQIVNIHGKWRVHAKVVPKWVPPREPIHKTVRLNEALRNKDLTMNQTSGEPFED